MMTVKELENDIDYSLLLMLPHDDIFPFVQEQVRARTHTMRFYFLMNILMLVAMAGFGIKDVSNGVTSWGGILQGVGLGTLLVFTLLIPVHEIIHGLAYKMIGAPRVSYGVNWRMFYFYAVADRFVVGRKSFLFVGLAPFVIVSLLAIAGIFLASVQLKWFLWGVLFMHTGACAGDFAMVSFYEQHRHYKDLLTYDDVAKKQSYFYVKYE